MSSSGTTLFLKTDALGDLVLFSGMLATLRRHRPGDRLAVLVRRPHGELGTLLVPGVEWWETTLDPYRYGPSTETAEQARLLEAVGRLAPSVLVAAGSRRTWLEILLASAAPGARTLALGEELEDPWFSSELRLATGLTGARIFGEVVPVPPDEPDWRRAYRLLDRLEAGGFARQPPALELAAPVLARADEVLAGLGLAPGGFMLVAAAGSANVDIKCWPLARFAEVLAAVWESRGIPSLAVGHASEAGSLERLRQLAPAALRVWTGGDGELGLLAGLVARARLCFGNDTGTMHLGAALGSPGVTLFGGGTWPRFIPASERSIALVHPLPCFGCGWDCPFGDAPCVRAIPVEAALGAVRELLDGPAAGPIRTLSLVPPATLELFARAGEVARARARERLQARGELAEQTHAAAERLGALERKEAELSRLAAALEARQAAILALDARRQELERLLEQARRSSQ